SRFLSCFDVVCRVRPDDGVGLAEPQPDENVGGRRNCVREETGEEWRRGGSSHARRSRAEGNKFSPGEQVTRAGGRKAFAQPFVASAARCPPRHGVRGRGYAAGERCRPPAAAALRLPMTAAARSSSEAARRATTRHLVCRQSTALDRAAPARER